VCSGDFAELVEELDEAQDTDEQTDERRTPHGG
jgi:hypothetical protein